MSSYIFTYEPDDNGTVLIGCPSFPEIATYADSRDEVYLPSLGALEEAVAARLVDGREVPPGDPRNTWADLSLNSETGRYLMKLPSLLQNKVELARLLRELGLTRADLMRRLEVNRETVDRLFRPNHATRHGQFDDAFRALGADTELLVTRKAG